jgi:cbb3-type cytochrome oxidase subunit 3
MSKFINTKNFLFILFIIIFVIKIIFNEQLNVYGISWGDVILLGTFLAAVYYAYVTHKVWQLEQKPVLRLQWNDLGRNNYFLGLKEKGESESNKNIKEYYNTFTDLELINDGKGSARDVIFDIAYLYSAKDIPGLRNITQIGPHGTVQLRYKGLIESNRHKIFNNEMESYKQPFKISVRYKNIEEEEIKCDFIIDEKYNDGFRIKF